MTDSNSDKKRRGLRRGQRQQVNYRETSESSDDSRASANKEKVKRHGRPRKERLSSDYSDGQSPSEREGRVLISSVALKEKSARYFPDLSP